ncbi:MAG: pyridoxal-phosphate dependent enzyme [Hamadaea sp.]|uniref:pyridoxal-phosphate dependent enzyme n=1 Tax=Hamadaea sp. TaxID=2024425 RepID=UPI00182F12D9|nr:pyridoxal-phosphate dependent enzyme [Hamadaea sp.]NUR47748.1 pyridoxal-phosphate dependent enzyme [Hamadaea sp.]NUR72284.1 pyridoxal-phosphate dependent enzyme [Hamadaea sp.]NUT23240.1 pyridoxal-phosphate dependent enzyme [Hamadaea sp.]
MVATVIATGMVTRNDVEAAAARTRNVVRHTPLTLVESGVFPATVMLKLEQLQHAGGYPVRGVFNQVIAGLERRTFDPDAGLVAAYTPAVAAAVVHVARRLDLPVTVFAPASAEANASTTLTVDGTLADAQLEAERHALATGGLHCPGLSPECWAQMVAGAGTVGLELWTQTLGQLDTVVVPERATALTAGITAALASHVRVVEAVSSPELCAVARHDLWEERRIAVDDVAACAYAYLREGYRPSVGERVAVVLSSADTAPSLIVRPTSEPTSEVGPTSEPIAPTLSVLSA